MKFLRTFSAHRNGSRLLLGSLLFLLLATVGAFFAGAARVRGEDFLALLRGEFTTGASILYYVRLPRIVAALFTGAALAVAGALIQTLLGNPIAGPNIIGVNAGAGLGAAIFCVLAPTAAAALPAAAFVGALAAVLTVWTIARLTGASRVTIILAGVAINSLIGAITDGIETIWPDTILARAQFRIGGLKALSTQVLVPACILIALALLVAFLMHNELDLLALGDETAASLGLAVRRCRLSLLLCSALLAGAAVSVAGLVGFVGLLVPHAARFFTGSEAKRMLPLSAVWGAGLMLVCDTLARVLFAPYELPVGVILSVLGAPGFLWLLLRRGKGSGYA